MVMTYVVTDLEIPMKLVRDIDLQLKEFNEMIPYEYNKNAYSPRLVNLLLSTCVVIERYGKFIQKECGLPDPTQTNGGMRQLLRNIDRNNVLSNMYWKTVFYDRFQPFTGEYDWWKLYNDTKHDEDFSITDVQYHDVVNAIVALHSLERLAFAKVSDDWTTLHGVDLIDSGKWDVNSHLQWTTYYDLFSTDSAPKK